MELDDTRKVHITKHGDKRTRERLGINKSAVEKNTKKALEFGIKHSETTGKLYKYITALYFNNPDCSNIRIYNRNVYIFNKNILVTVMQLPQRYHAAADKIAKNKEKLEDNNGDN